MKKISMTSIVTIIIGIVPMIFSSPLGALIYDMFNRSGPGHRCSAYGYSQYCVDFAGIMDLYHPESCANVIMAFGLIFVIMGALELIGDLRKGD